MPQHSRRKIAVIGSGISGLSAAWLLHRDHDITVFERNAYVGGHSHTVDISVMGQPVAVDTGFIVYNPPNYPNLTALFDHLGVETHETAMSFAASIDNGAFEYSGGDGPGLLAQPSNLLRPRFWSMIAGILRFYRQAPALQRQAEERGSNLGELLSASGFGGAFVRDHLAPMAGAIWSSDCRSVLDMPAAPFMRFFRNHGLTQLAGRPVWRSVLGGSRAYVEKLSAPFRDHIRLSCPVVGLEPVDLGTRVMLGDGSTEVFTDIIFACHSDEALALISNLNSSARAPLSAMRYSSNSVILHGDVELMPKRRAAWAAWNFLSRSDNAGAAPCVTYWMNALQQLGTDTPVLVTLNPDRPIRDDQVHGRFEYDHPVFDQAALAARTQLTSLQGHRGLWFAGAYLGDGFHEDGIQAGLAVAEMIGPLRRPWKRPGQNGRIGLPDVIVPHVLPKPKPSASEPQPVADTAPVTLMRGHVWHRRRQPKLHAFRYPSFYLLLDLDRLDELDGMSAILSVNRRNILSFRERDHGEGDGPLKPRISKLFADRFGGWRPARLELLTMPRCLGFAFNPISVYFGYEADGLLGGVVYEVSNTFGERHSYVFRLGAGAGSAPSHDCAKAFHVSPFFKVEGRYELRHRESPKGLTLAIRYRDDSGQILFDAGLKVAPMAVTTRNLFGALGRMPLGSIGVILAIHWQALKLWVKRVPVYKWPGKVPETASYHIKTVDGEA